MKAKKLAIYFLPLVATSVLRLIGIPLTTYILGPADYGLFALMMGVVTVCTVLATSVTGFLVNHKVVPGSIAPPKLVSTLAVIEIVLGLILTALCIAAWPVFVRGMGITGDISRWGFLAMLLTVPMGAFWSSGCIIMVFDGRATLYSGTLIAQAVVQLVTNMFALYVLHWHVGALIAGQFTGVLTCAVGGYIGLHKHFSPGLSRWFARESFSLMPWAMISGFANSATDLLERLVLGRVTNTFQLGVYVHSQNYRTMLGTAGKAFVLVLQPTMMREAQAGQTQFQESRAGWDIVYVMFTLFGLLFALLGKEIIGLLTHGKFAGAALYVPFWSLMLMFQYLGRAQVAMLQAHGKGKLMSLALFISNICSGILMLTLGIPFHAPGLIAAVLIGEVVNRILLQYWARKLWSLPFQDGVAILGAVTVCVVTLVVYAVPIPFFVRIVIYCGLVLVPALVMGPRARTFFLRSEEGAS